MRSIRLLPTVILTAIMLLALKSFSLISGDYSALMGVDRAIAQEEPMDTEQAGDDMAMEGDAATDETVAADMAEESEVAQAAPDDANTDRVLVEDNVVRPIDSSRDQLLERLGERRQVMDEREQDLRVREQLLEAAERRLEERLAELTALETRVTEAVETEEERQSEEIGRLVQVYSAMRAKDAAAIFDLLELPILVEVAQAMNPRKMADILGNMEPEAARRLTIALAGSPVSTVSTDTSSNGQLPQIEGVPIQ